jgi:hypothetical protein
VERHAARQERCNFMGSVHAESGQPSVEEEHPKVSTPAFCAAPVSNVAQIKW